MFKKSNYIELKTLEYYFKWNTKKAREVYKVRHCLKSDWFELFIKYYFKKLWYEMNKWIWWLKADGWIDLRWYWNYQNIYIQCKKYIKNNKFKWVIGIWDIRNFFWWIVSIDENYKNTFNLFINTWTYTSYARNFAENNGIELWDYEDIASICEVYNYEDFLYDIKKKWYKLGKYLSYQQNWMFPIKQDDLTEEDIFIYLSNIREKLASVYHNWNNHGYIYKDTTLRIFAKNRPYNLKELKKIWKINEDSNTDIYWLEILKGLELLKN